MTAILNLITAAAIVTGVAAFIAILIWLTATFGRDALEEHRIRATHRAYLADQAAARLDAQERTAGYVRAHSPSTTRTVSL